MDPFKSTTESPLRFLTAYLYNDGESYLQKQFESSALPGFTYIPERDINYVIKILPHGDNRGELLDEETNEREFELSFPEFVREVFIEQLKITKGLIYQQSKQNTDGHDLKLYKHILIDCLYIQKSIDNIPELNFKSELSKFNSSILSDAYNKFERYHPKTPEYQHVKQYFRKKTDSNCTGFKLNPPPRNASLKDIFERMMAKEFVAKGKMTEVSLHQFFNGEIPKSKINWEKDLYELKYFIDVIIDGGILLKNPGQQWKYMKDIFTCQGEVLEKDWNKNHNKLKSPEKRQAIENLASMLRSRI